MGMDISVATPEGYSAIEICWCKKAALESGAKINIGYDPYGAVNNADVVYTDTWSVWAWNRKGKRIEPLCLIR